MFFATNTPQSGGCPYRVRVSLFRTYRTHLVLSLSLLHITSILLNTKNVQLFLSMGKSREVHTSTFFSLIFNTLSCENCGSKTKMNENFSIAFFMAMLLQKLRETLTRHPVYFECEYGQLNKDWF